YPDFIIGNYSDGNLVASLLACKMGVTQCTIAHALEKTKYPDSGTYWRKFDDKYHFSCQFTADLIAMNSADFIITSTYQEIAGTHMQPNATLACYLEQYSLLLVENSPYPI
ncbi:sucrose synthase 2-like, partial [Trifolium medium]|nr:sucrose synthase 2-like [Trifolium medium]